MSRQIILCVETNKHAQTDYIYLKEIITKFYDINQETKLTPVYLGGKFNYNNQKTLREIDLNIEMYEPNGETVVIYTFDKDKHCVRYQDNEFVEQTTKFCEINSYELIWFVEDIEEVLIGEKIEDDKKTSAAIKFKRKSTIDTFNEIKVKKLSIAKPTHSKTSNVLFILDKVLTRKNKC